MTIHVVSVEHYRGCGGDSEWFDSDGALLILMVMASLIVQMHFLMIQARQLTQREMVLVITKMRFPIMRLKLLIVTEMGMGTTAKLTTAMIQMTILLRSLI
jgi:hypothetical protein